LEARRLDRIRVADRRLVQRARLVLVNSRYTADRVWREYGVDAEHCPPGVTLPDQTAALDRNHILAVGALEPHKGHELVVQAAGRLPEALRPPVHIVANDGSGAYRARLESLALELAVDLTIRVRISEEALQAEYEQALVFCYGARLEPLGLAPLEAMANAVPVVAVYEGGLPETVIDGRTGFLVKADPAVFANRLEWLLADPDLRKAMGAAARREVAERWDWPSHGGKMERLLAGIALQPYAAAASR
jgi:phosphatidylinositol alpha-1,6-mannosyltransferase